MAQTVVTVIVATLGILAAVAMVLTAGVGLVTLLGEAAPGSLPLLARRRRRLRDSPVRPNGDHRADPRRHLGARA